MMDLPLENVVKIKFKKKNEAVSPDLRPLYKIAIICLVLYLSSNKETATLMKLQLLMWTIKSPARYKALVEMKEGKGIPIIRFDPSLNRALSLAVAEKIVSFNVKNGKFTLAELGKAYAIKIMKTEDLLIEEKEFLHNIKKSISDSLVAKSLKRSIRIDEWDTN